MEPELIPDYTERGRPYSQKHRLGRVMWSRGHTDTYHIAAECDVSPRQLSRYLAGEAIRPEHLARLSAELECPSQLLQEPENGGLTLEEYKEQM